MRAPRSDCGPCQLAAIIGAGVANAVAINNAIDNTGLWLKVRDIDYGR